MSRAVWPSCPASSAKLTAFPRHGSIGIRGSTSTATPKRGSGGVRVTTIFGRGSGGVRVTAIAERGSGGVRVTAIAERGSGGVRDERVTAASERTETRYSSKSARVKATQDRRVSCLVQ